MFNREKSWILKKINAYFLFIALALGISVYLLLLDNTREYDAKVNVLISPNNIKTAVHLDKLIKNIPIIVSKNNLLKKDVSVKINNSNSIIEVRAFGKNEAVAVNLAQDSTREILNLVSKYYDIKNDLSLEIISRESEARTSGQGIIIFGSVAVGLILAFFIQLILDFVEKIILFFISRKIVYNNQRTKAKKEIDNFFKLNREKIQKLSLPFSSGADDQKMARPERDFGKNIFSARAGVEMGGQQTVNFKKASSPANLPIAEEDLNKIVQFEKDEDVFISPVEEFSKNSLSSEVVESTVVGNKLKEAFGEPTEEEFKRRLNQLLGNK